MNRIITLFVSLFVVLAVSAQSDQNAKSLLEQTSKKMQSYASMSANFVFTMENSRMNIKEENSGSLLLKGKKYQVNLPDLGMKVYSDGKTVWNLMEAAGQVMITNVGDDSQGGIDPSAIFNIYQEGYTFKFVEDKQEGGKTISYVDLFPDDKNAEFSKIRVGVDKSGLMVQSLVTHGKDGNQYGIYVRDYKTGLAIADSEFVYDKTKHRNIEEIDFR
ncbi:MAG: LolA family protein [Bacteroidota bacterium]